MRAFLDKPAPVAGVPFGELAGVPGEMAVARHADRIADRILSW
jgi:hypothetical protein